MRRMSRTPWAAILTLLAAASLCLAGCWDKPKKTAWSNATGAEAFERLMWDDIKNKDWNSVEQHLGASFVMTTPAGVYNRASTMQYLQGMTVEDYSMGEVVVTPNGSDMVVTYTISLRGSEGGKALTQEALRMMTVWQQVKHGWIAIAHSAMPARAGDGVGEEPR